MYLATQNPSLSTGIARAARSGRRCVERHPLSTAANRGLITVSGPAFGGAQVSGIGDTWRRDYGRIFGSRAQGPLVRAIRHGLRPLLVAPHRVPFIRFGRSQIGCLAWSRSLGRWVPEGCSPTAWTGAGCSAGKFVDAESEVPVAHARC